MNGFDHRHLLDLDGYSRTDIEYVLDAAESMAEILDRQVPQVPALRGVKLANMFFESSTRTRISFELAAKALGAEVINFAAAGSSLSKGESMVDTLATVAALGADMFVMRHARAGAPHLAARILEGPVINAGDGCHAHPSQGLLDALTIRRRFGAIDGLKVVIVGDIRHSRVARSNILALGKLGAELVLCGPPQLVPGQLATMPAVSIESDLDRAAAGADVLMGLRIQRERMAGPWLASTGEYVASYSIRRRHIESAGAGAILMHPGPQNTGVEIEPDLADSDRSVISEQVTAGLAVRMAVIYLLARNVLRVET